MSWGTAARAGLWALPWAMAGLSVLLMSALVCRPAWGQRHFDEVAAESGLDFVHFNGMSGELYFAEIAGSGVALLDYDNDGDLDVYLVQGAMLGPNPVAAATFPPPGEPSDRLFRNDLVISGDGRLRPRFVDVTDASGIEAAGYGIGVAAGDADNDGWTDLYITNLGANQMLSNNGDGTFSDVTEATGTGDRRWGISAAFVDYDLDGWLDLYVTNYTEYRAALDKACFSATGARDYCSPLSYEPETDSLYRNRGDGTYRDASVALGIDALRRNGLGVATGDFDSDGWPDLYVTNDQMTNTLWMNGGDGTFADDALIAGCAVNETGMVEASMGVVVADLDGDGAEDIFMSHLAGETNTVYINDGSGFFDDQSRFSGLGVSSLRYTGFGIGQLDYDLDGRLDLYVANGAVTVIEELARAGDPYPLEQTDQLFRNVGGGRFEENSALAGEVFNRAEVGRGVAVGDLDLDGDPDLVVVNNSGPAWHLENSGRLQPESRWLSVRLLTAPGGRDVTGTRVSVLAHGSLRHRRVATDGSYGSASAPQVGFGLGSNDAGKDAVDLVRAEWTGGGATEWRSLPGDRHYVVYRDVGD